MMKKIYGSLKKRTNIMTDSIEKIHGLLNYKTTIMKEQNVK